MSALTPHLADDRRQRLRAFTKSRHTTINRLLDEMTMLMLADFDAEARFKLYAAQGSAMTERGLQLLGKAAQHGVAD